MKKMFYALLMVIGFAHITDAANAREPVPSLLRYNELMELSPKNREAYLKGVGQLLQELESLQGGNKSKTSSYLWHFNNLAELLISEAAAQTASGAAQFICKDAMYTFNPSNNTCFIKLEKGQRACPPKHAKGFMQDKDGTSVVLCSIDAIHVGTQEKLPLLPRPQTAAASKPSEGASTSSAATDGKVKAPTAAPLPTQTPNGTPIPESARKAIEQSKVVDQKKVVPQNNIEKQNQPEKTSKVDTSPKTGTPNKKVEAQSRSVAQGHGEVQRQGVQDACVPQACQGIREGDREKKEAFKRTGEKKCINAGMVLNFNHATGKCPIFRGPKKFGATTYGPCEQGETMCMPMVFGAYADNTAICVPIAVVTTRECENRRQSAVMSGNHKDVSNAEEHGIKEEWDTFVEDLKRLCVDNKESAEYHCNECLTIAQHVKKLLELHPRYTKGDCNVPPREPVLPDHGSSTQI